MRALLSPPALANRPAAKKRQEACQRSIMVKSLTLLTQGIDNSCSALSQSRSAVGVPAPS
jgi:hypothetical protein